MENVYSHEKQNEWHKKNRFIHQNVVGRHRMYRKRLSFVAPPVAQTGVVLLPISTGSLDAYQRISSES